MNYGSMRHYLRLRYFKAPDDGGAGGGGGTSSPPSGSDAGGASPSGGDTGGSSVPSPSPDGGGTPSPSPSPDTNSDPWGPLGSLEDLDHVELPPQPQTPPSQPPAEPAPQAPPAQPQPAAPQPQPQTPPQPVAQPQGQTPQAPEPQAPQIDLSPSDPAGMAAAMEQNAPALIQHLAQERFQLTPEEVQELETDVTSAVPKLLAKVHLQSQIAMQKFLAQAVPGMIQRHTQVSRANDEAENKFFDTHKALGLDKNNKQHREVAIRTAKLYRQMYPQASLDQLISDIGPMVAMNLKLAPGAAAPQPQVPGAPVMPRGGTPFRPAVNGGGGALPSTPAAADGNEWAGLGQNYD